MVGTQQLSFGADLVAEITKSRDDYSKRVVDAKADFDNQIKRYSKGAISRYESLAGSAVRNGDIPAANMAWQEILFLDRNHEAALSHFKAIGQLETVLKDLGKSFGVADSPTAEAKNIAQMTRRLTNTKWGWMPEAKQFMMFRPNGVIQGTWGLETGTWYVNPDLTVTWYYSDLGYVNIMTFDKNLTQHRSIVFKKDLIRIGNQIP